MKPSTAIRLGCVTIDYPPQKGGVARYLSQLRHVSKGGIEVYADERLGVSGEHSVHSVPLFWTFRLGWMRMIPLFFRLRKECQAFFVSHVLPVGTVAWIVKTIAGGRAYSILLHGMDFRSALHSLRKRWIMRHVLRGAMVVYANSIFVTDEIRKFDPSIHARLLPPGVSTISIPDRPSTRAHFGVRSDEVVVLAVSRLTPRKGIDRLIEAMFLLPDSVRLVVVGDGDDADRLKHLAHGYGKRVLFVRDADDRTRNAWYAASDVFALPVREEGVSVEGFGIVYLEAAMAGLPCVAGKSGGAVEAVIDGVTGLIVDPENPREIARAIRSIVDDPEWGRRLGAAGKLRVQRDFRWEDRWKVLEEHTPLVSVIIPVHDRPAVFLNCLTHLARQTYGRIEVIVVEDGSRDDMQSVLQRSALPFDVRFFRTPTHLGAAGARNFGAEYAQGEYLLFLDADCFLRRDAVEQFLKALFVSPKANFAYSSFRFGWKLFRSYPFDDQRLRRVNYIHTTSLIRRASFPGFDPSLKKFQDWDLWLTIALRGGKGVWIPKILFRLHPDGVMSRWLPAFFHRIPWDSIGYTPKELVRYREAKEIIERKHQL